MVSTSVEDYCKMVTYLIYLHLRITLEKNVL